MAVLNKPSAAQEIVESHPRLKPVASHMLQIVREESQRLLECDLEGEAPFARIFTVGKINIAEADVIERFLAEKLEKMRVGLSSVMRTWILLKDNHDARALPRHAEPPTVLGEKAFDGKTATPVPVTGKKATPVPNP